MKFTAETISTLPEAQGPRCAVVAFPAGAREPLSTLLSEGDRRALGALKTSGVITNKAGEVYYLPTPVSAYAGALAICLGDEADAETMRRAGGAAAPLLTKHRIAELIFDAASAPHARAGAFFEGIALGQYTFDHYKEKKQDTPASVHVGTAIAVLAKETDLEEARSELNALAIQCAAANWARDLAHLASNDLTPAGLAEQARAMAGETGCACEILDESRMRELGMNLLLAVGGGSGEPSKLILLEYRHPAAKRTIAIVGKGITFDTGGISIKPGEGMHEMKYDMCGAAAALGAMKAIALLKPPLNVIGAVPAAENMPGGRAVTPGEIHRAYNGKTVETLNTDAEGRLVLADALAYTIDRYKPDEIVDLATLTGAAIVALGHYAGAVLTPDDALYATLEEAGRATGERVWRLPLWEDYEKLIEGTHADLANIGPARQAGVIVGGAFLKAFVGATPWAHIDIAGAAWGGKNISYLDSKHTTGYGVRLLTRWLLSRS